ncbi:MAG: type VI secretion system Vgr family protein [Aquabacterium sp.]|nr:type VI secretion system Vgr family protein [Aquabacterium sp.]
MRGLKPGADHPGTVSGWHYPHLDGQGANQWLVDDATGQLRMRLASHSSQTGWASSRWAASSSKAGRADQATN